MDFSAFDTSRIDEYADRARANWGKTEAYKEFEQKQQGRTPADDRSIAENFMQLFAEFGAMQHLDPASNEAQAQVEKLRSFITEHYYNCTKQILSGLGKMYSGGGEFTENINRAGGEGAAEFAAEAIAIYCGE